MNISKIASGVVNVVNEKVRPDKLIGLDYSCVDDFVKSDFSKSAIALAAKEGKLNQEMIEQMILQRLPRTIKQAEMFALEHPELSKEDVTQDLIAYMVKMANEYKGQHNGDFNHYSVTNEKRYLESIYSKTSEKNIQSLPLNPNVIQGMDEYLDERMQKSNSEDIAELMSRLSPREEYVLIKSFGLDGEEPKTATEIAREFSISLDTVRNIKDKAIKRMGYFFSRRVIKENLRVLNTPDLQEKMAHLADRNMLSE